MAALPTLTDELSAVNTMLDVIGEDRVNSLTGDNIADVAIARETLNSTNREVQSRGWHFNTEDDYPFAPNVDGEITLPGNILRADSMDARTDVTQRGSKLYDRKNRTYQFTGSVKLQIILFLPFDEIPETARKYITIKAARRFASRMVMSDEIDSFSFDDENEARILLEESEGDTADHNIFSNPFFNSFINRGH